MHSKDRTCISYNSNLEGRIRRMSRPAVYTLRAIHAYDDQITLLCAAISRLSKTSYNYNEHITMCADECDSSEGSGCSGSRASEFAAAAEGAGWSPLWISGGVDRVVVRWVVDALLEVND